MHLFFRVVIPIRPCQVVGGGILLERYITTVSSRGWQGGILREWRKGFRGVHVKSLSQSSQIGRNVDCLLIFVPEASQRRHPLFH